MAVGDPCQAIYGWRGASVSNIEQFPAQFPRGSGAAGDRAIRSASTGARDRRILETANVLAAPLQSAFAGAEPLAARPASRRGGSRLAVHETYDDELEFLAAEVPARATRPAALVGDRRAGP